MLCCDCLLKWQIVADTRSRSTVLGLALLCSALSKNPFELTFCSATWQRTSTMPGWTGQKALSALASVLGVSTLSLQMHHFLFFTQFHALRGWPHRHDQHFFAFCFWLVLASDETGWRISLLQCAVCSFPGPGTIQSIAKSSSLLGGHPVSWCWFYHWNLLVLSRN